MAQGTNILNSFEGEKNKVLDLYSSIFPSLFEDESVEVAFPPGHFSLANFLWAYTAYTARSLPDRVSSILLNIFYLLL